MYFCMCLLLSRFYHLDSLKYLLTLTRIREKKVRKQKREFFIANQISLIYYLFYLESLKRKMDFLFKKEQLKQSELKLNLFISVS